MSIQKKHIAINKNDEPKLSLAQEHSDSCDNFTNLQNVVFMIGGMTCINCENKIRQSLENTDGVIEADVSYSTSKAIVTFDSELIAIKEIANIIHKLGYEVVRSKRTVDIVSVIGILIVIAASYMLLEMLGFLNVLVPSKLADTQAGYGMMFVIGLATSVHCIAMCGGINLSQSISHTKLSSDKKTKGKKKLYPTIMYNCGRVVSYTAIGAILGTFGMIIGQSSYSGVSFIFQGVLKILAGVFMVIMGINMLQIFPWLRKISIHFPKIFATKINKIKLKNKTPFLIGLLNGLMPCGPLQSVQFVALASANPFSGALSMFMFSLGTVPLMLTFGMIVTFLGKKFFKAVTQVGAVLVVIFGYAMISQGGSLSGLFFSDSLMVVIVLLSVAGVIMDIVYNKTHSRVKLKNSAVILAVSIYKCIHLFHCMGIYSDSNSSNSDVKAEIIDGVQVVTTNLLSGQYPDITVKKGVPVKWIINAYDGTINGCNYKMLLKEYNIDYEFKKGENVIEFIPKETGSIQYSCWMGMITGKINVN